MYQLREGEMVSHRVYSLPRFSYGGDFHMMNSTYYWSCLTLFHGEIYLYAKNL